MSSAVRSAARRGELSRTPSPPRAVDRLGLLYGGAVALGSVLVTLTAINQPYNENEWAQIRPYGSSDVGIITSGTRQPPLDPLLGAFVQHLLGEGQLRQRLVPVLCGIGSLLLMAALIRTMRLGLSGALAMYVMATAPVFLRYSAYIRPYALPVLLMLACCYGGCRWLETGRYRWFALAVTPALLLPLARVPEPVTFLAVAALVLLWLSSRGALPRVRGCLLAAGLFVSLLTVGLLTTFALSSKTSGNVFDLNPVHAVQRSGAGLREIATYVVPLYASWFPWWPVTLLVLVLGLALRDARTTLHSTWFWLPLLLAPVVFLLAYHTLNSFPLDVRHYRARFAYFFVPAFVIVVGAVGRAVAEWATRRNRSAWLGAAVPFVLLVSQLPSTYSILTNDNVPDYGGAGAVLRESLPPDAVVLYDSPAPLGYWRQPFSGASRYLEGAPAVYHVSTLAKGKRRIKESGPVYLLILDSRCATSVGCDMPARTWDHTIAGYHEEELGWFTLYAPEAGQAGVDGAEQALGAIAEAYGRPLASADVNARAALLEHDGQYERAHRRIERYCAGFGPDGGATTRCFRTAVRAGLYPRSEVPRT